MAITASNVASGSFQGSAPVFPSTLNLFSPWLQTLASPLLASRGSTLLGCQYQSSNDTNDIPGLTTSSRRSGAKQKASAPRASTSTRRSTGAVTQKSQYSVINDKPIRKSNHLRREGAKYFTAPTNALRREDSFILVDHGSHFAMVKPGYARAHYQRTPDNILSIAGYHAFDPVNVDREVEVRKLAGDLGCVLPPVPVANVNSNLKRGTKRVRFDQPEDDEPQTPRKRARVTPPPGL